jgi:TusA-related sulfurtransferase
MSNEREKKQILMMLEDGKITAEQAEKLLKALEASDGKEAVKNEIKPAGVSEKISVGKLKGKFKVEVQSADGDNVMVTLPLMLAKLAINMMPAGKMAEIKANGVDIMQIVNNIEDFIDMVDEDIVNVQSADGDRVRIYIEK